MILDLFDIDYSKIQLWLKDTIHLNVSIDLIGSVFNIIIFIAILIFIVKCGKTMLNWISNVFTEHNRWRKRYIKDHLNIAFLSYNTKESRQKYIQTRIQNEAPSNYEELEDSNVNSISENFIQKFLDAILIESNTRRLYCILADSGMGKSTALVNLFTSYINKYKQTTIPFEIRILSLADDNVLDNINKIDNQQKTILLLDALDENIEAVENHNIFLAKLEKTFVNFRFVVITCRTQFFPSEQEQLKQSKLIKEDGETKGFAAYNTFYVSPFNDEEISQYLNRVFGKRNFRKETIERRKRADEIIENPKCRSLIVRPMILAHIEQLAKDDRDYHMAIDIYDAMVDYWLNREVGRMAETQKESRKELLRKLSSELAQDIFNNRTERRGYYINKDDFETFLNSRDLSNDTLHFRERSLLNRDGAGLVKFSHKSFLEYFLAQNYFNDASAIDDLSGMDFLKVLYDELCIKYINESFVDGNVLYHAIERNVIYENKHKSVIMPFISIVIKKIGSLKLRYLEGVHANKLHLSDNISPNIFNETYDWMLNIYALEIDTKNRITNLNLIRKFPNLSYLFINSNVGMSNGKLISQVTKTHPNITLVLNNKCIVDKGNLSIDELLLSSSTIIKINQLNRLNEDINDEISKMRMTLEQYANDYSDLSEFQVDPLDRIPEKTIKNH
jgi:hypothetical protein